MVGVAGAAAVNLAVFERERARILVGAEQAVRRAVVDDGVADRDVIGVVIHAARRARRHFEALKDVVVTGEFDGVRAAREHRALAVHGHAEDRDLVRGGPGLGEADPARVGGAAVDLHGVARLELRRDRLQVRVRLARSDLVRGEGLRELADGAGSVRDRFGGRAATNERGDQREKRTESETLTLTHRMTSFVLAARAPRARSSGPAGTSARRQSLGEKGRKIVRSRLMRRVPICPP